jgi:hypothetical protein
MVSGSRVPYIRSMIMKRNSSVHVTVGRDAKTGRMIADGYGALKGQYVVREGVNVTKPIYQQVSDRSHRRAAPRKVGKG